MTSRNRPVRMHDNEPIFSRDDMLHGSGGLVKLLRSDSVTVNSTPRRGADLMLGDDQL